MFSRFAWSFPLKNKEGKYVANAFRELFDQNLIPKKLCVDRGTEFCNREVTRLIREYHFMRYSTRSTNRKPVTVERFNRQ